MISVVIPALNEERSIACCIKSVQRNGAPYELLVVDGGSSDATRIVAAELGAAVLESPVRQRAGQMNYGADHSQGEVLLFLHADTILPPTAFLSIESALRNSGTGGGAFARRFDSNSTFLRITCWMAEIRNRVIGWHLGDQAMFVRRELFDDLGGFREVDQFEDLDFSRRLGRRTQLATLRPPVVSSARRFNYGPVNRTFRDLSLTLSYLRNGVQEIASQPGTTTAFSRGKA